MPRYVAFLRALNVGGHNVLKMDALRAHFEAAGLDGVETFITSGNVIFASRARDVAKLRAKIESHLGGALGRPTTLFLRSDAEVAAIAAQRPFGEIDPAAAGAFNVGLTAAALTPAQTEQLRRFETPVDRFVAVGPEIYWRTIAVRQSDSKFSAPAMEWAIGMPLTFRGMNTMARLAAKYPPPTAPG